MKGIYFTERLNTAEIPAGTRAVVIIQPLSARERVRASGDTFQGVYVPHDPDYVPGARFGFSAESVAKMLADGTVDGWATAPIMQTQWPSSIGVACADLRERGLVDIANWLMRSRLWTFTGWPTGRPSWIRPRTGETADPVRAENRMALTPPSLPLAILARRTSYPLTQAALSEMTGVPASRIGEYERGERDPSLATLAALASVLGPFAVGELRAQYGETVESDDAVSVIEEG